MTGSLPNGELVAQAWIAAYAGIPAGQVAGTLPPPVKWTASGFVQVRAVSGGPVFADLPHRRVSVTQLDFWGTRIVNDTSRPLWAVAMLLAERVRVATFPGGPQAYGKPLDMPVAGFLPARVLSGYLLSEPTRVERDPSGYARMTCNLSLAWTV